MEKQKPWQFWLIVAVIVLTLYNILPTIFYYAKPLHQPVDEPRAQEVAHAIVGRVNALEEDAEQWLAAFCRLLDIQPAQIELQANNPGLIKLVFTSDQDAQRFKRFLPEAGNRIPFAPARLSLNPPRDNQLPTEVYVARQVHVHLDPKESNQLFHFTPKRDAQGNIASLYRDIVYDRATQIALAFSAPNRLAAQIGAFAESSEDKVQDDWLINSAKEIVEAFGLINSNSAILDRWLASLAQAETSGRENAMHKYQQLLETTLARLQEKQKEEQSEEIADQAEHAKRILDNQIRALTQATQILNQHESAFKNAVEPLTRAKIAQLLKDSEDVSGEKEEQQIVDLQGTDAFVQSIIIDWNASKILVQLYPDIVQLRERTTKKETEDFVREKLNRWIYDDMARVSSLSDETLVPDNEFFSVKLNQLTDTQSLLTFDLGYVAGVRARQVLDQLQTTWVPHHIDLTREAYPINDWKTFKTLSSDQQRLGLVVYAPAVDNGAPLEGFSSDSIYVIAKGLGTILEKYQTDAQAEGSQEFQEDIQDLARLLQQNGFIAFPGSTFGIDPAFQADYIFKLDDYYGDLISATREDFVVKGSKRYATLDFADVEQRILTENHILDRTQEDLLKWSEEYNAAQVDLDVGKHYLVPAPTKNLYWENFKISAFKYFNGDDRKVLKWGLDLSGGKTVRIGLRDSSGRPVTDPNDINQASNELYNRLNKMGVAERTIRIENKNIVLDFPGSQGFSASELVKASAMYFHIVNEKFRPSNKEVGAAVQSFLQGIWNEAVITNRKDVDSINEIAFRHLGEGSAQAEGLIAMRSSAAQTLLDYGLKLANPKEEIATTAFNDTLSRIGVLRGTDSTDWNGQSHPLVVIFHNYALEGSSLTNIQTGWDQNQGNFLSFSVKNSYSSAHEAGMGSPREDFYAWTSQFSEDRIAGTPKEVYSNGSGWGMAVILNGEIITRPALRQALRDNASITGRFTQREVNQLAADLKAGSLSFTPRILSEENVSPELGKEERSKGIRASLIALALIVLAMISYYRFGGVVASCAVLLNILIMWGVLQNLDAALTLPGIAGIVLTIGMAIDANVLVFERVREEFKKSGRIASAIQAGYRKAFTAIFDSNITTIIVALILIQFDSGPIKGFAITLIIGIISSMFTALFMTRYFFAGWVQNPANKELHMAELIQGTNFDFLAQTRKAVVISIIVVVAGLGLLAAGKKTIFGMDFTGGYSLVVDVQEQPDSPDYRLQAIDALLAQGATSNDVQVRQLTYPWQLRIQLGMSMEEKDHPFHQMPTEVDGDFTYSYQHNPRIVWVVNALQNGGLSISEAEKSQLEHRWTLMSGQFSDAMRNNAIMGLSLALLAILVYITLRFEFKYAVAAVVGLVHDVAITLGVIALFHKLGFAVQIDLQTIGAIMTIIGYSLNDTIIVFDRIREDTLIMRKTPFRQVVNHAINVTLSRTLMTSGTTTLVLLALVLFGGASIFSFSLVMMVGVIVGTLSSLFIASPVMLYLHDREERMQQAALAHRKA